MRPEPVVVLSKRVKQLKSQFEKDFALLLHRCGIEFTYEAEKLPYTIECIYNPDFSLPGGILIETKGLFTSIDRRKHLAVKMAHPERDIRFIFQRDNRIHKNSNTRYSDWCKRHGFKYHVGIGFPKEWLKDVSPHKTKLKKTPNKKH